MSGKPTISGEQLAAMLGVGMRRFYQIRSDDPNIPKSGNIYDCHEIGKWLRNRAIAELGVTQTGEVYDYDAEKARLTFHQANIQQLEESIRRKDVIPADQVKEHWASLVSNARAKLMSLPGKIAVRVVGAATVQEAEREAKAMIYEALDELAGNGIPD